MFSILNGLGQSYKFENGIFFYSPQKECRPYSYNVKDTTYAGLPYMCTHILDLLFWTKTIIAYGIIFTSSSLRPCPARTVVRSVLRVEVVVQLPGLNPINLASKALHCWISGIPQYVINSCRRKISSFYTQIQTFKRLNSYICYGLILTFIRARIFLRACFSKVMFVNTWLRINAPIRLSLLRVGMYQPTSYWLAISSYWVHLMWINRCT